MNNYYQEGQLPIGGQATIDVTTMHFPASITLTSAAGGRLIELGFDGTNFFSPTVDVSTAAFITVAVTAPVRNMRITGNAGDTWSFRSAP